MPFLRFARDARGYENTYVLHGFRGGEHAGPRLLYWFRTPPNVRVGRLPLDETAIRAIEESNPELTFDWTKMLKVKPKAPPAPSSARRSGGRRAATRRPAPPGAASVPGENGATLEEESAPVAASDAANIDAAEVDAAGIDAAGIDAAEVDAAGIDAVGIDGGDAGAPGADEAVSRHPVAALVGDDGLARLRARYAELRARVAEKQVTSSAREALEARVEALNPDAWRAGEAVVRAIERFEADVEQIRKTLGRRSRRRPGRAGRGGSSRSGAGAGRSRREDASEGASTPLEGSHEGPQSG
ncbi:MAG: hypothetical protein J4F37_08445 [Acidobacteria bacterium]|nr:hypothetical protein [Acidobacteriota bacterium]